MIFPESAEHLTALQRVSLNGNYQDARILPVLTSGAATACGTAFAASTRRRRRTRFFPSPLVGEGGADENRA
jgi:hypothetical protein